MNISGNIIQNIQLTELHSFRNHPFKIRNDNAMQETVESIKEHGVLVPVIVRPDKDGGYEIIAGHRRKYASELAGYKTIPAIIQYLDDDTATIIMVDSNLQREEILPSERATAYKMKLEAIKRQGTRTDLTSMQNAEKLSVEKVGDEVGISKDQVRRYIRLTELTPALQAMVDEKKIAVTPAVELSYLKPNEQSMLIMTIDSEQATPSLSQAQRMKRQSREGTLTEDSMLAIMCEQKKPDWDRITLDCKTLRKYFPINYTPYQIETAIFRLLERWHSKQCEKAERYAVKVQTDNEFI